MGVRRINRGYCGNLELWQGCGTSGTRTSGWVFSVPETAFSIDMDMGLSPVRLRPIKLNYVFPRFQGPPLAQHRTLSQEHYLKAIKMHAKRTLFNYGKIFVITRPLPSTIPIPTLFSLPSCPTLQPTTLTITNFPMSSKGVLNWRATRIPVGPPLLLFYFSRVLLLSHDDDR